MISPRSPKFSEFNSFSNGNIPQDSASIRRVPNQIYDDRMKSYNQLSNFYLPHLNKIYESNKQTVAYLKPPEELLFNSRLFEMRENEIKKKLETVQKDNEIKQQKIKDLNAKVVHLVERLRMHEPMVSVDVQVPFNGFTEVQKDLKRVENLLRIKNQETLFSIKMKAMSLLEQFSIDRADIEGMHQIETQNGVFEFMLQKLKSRIKDYNNKSLSRTEQTEKSQVNLFKLQEEIRFLSDSNEMIRNSERKLKQKYQDIKKQWSQSNQRVIQKEKENEQMDIEIFRLKKLLEQKQGLLIKYNSKMHNNTILADQVKVDYELQVKDLRRLLSSYSAQIADLKQQLEWKQGEYEELKIDYDLKVHEYQKVHREYIRWKDRYDNYQKEKYGSHEDTTRYIEINRQLENENSLLKQQIAALQFSEPISPIEGYDVRTHDRVLEKLRSQVISKSEQVEMMAEKIDRLQKEKKNRDSQTQDSSLVIERKYERMLKQMEALYKTNKVKIHEDWQEAYNQLKSRYQRDTRQLQEELSRIKKYQPIRRGQQGPFNYRAGLDRELNR